MIVNPTYLERHKDEGEDLRNFGVPLSHRFRSLKLWCVLRNYGLNGLQKYIRNHIEMAKYFKTLMESDPNFKIVNNVHLGLVCFKLFPPGKSPELLDYMNSQLLNNVNASGELHIIPTDYKGSRIIRYCVTMENATKPQIGKFIHNASVDHLCFFSLFWFQYNSFLIMTSSMNQTHLNIYSLIYSI